MCCGPTVTTTTLRACLRKGIPIATVTAVSVLPFHAIATTSPRVGRLRFGTISTGRPLSNKASSRVASAIEASFSGCSTMIRSKTRQIIPTTAFCRRSSSRQEALGPLWPAGTGSSATPFVFMKSRNSRRAWSRRSWPSRSRVRSTSDEIENPISPPNTTAYSVVRLCRPTTWLSKRCAAINEVSSTGPALPSPITASRFFIARAPCADPPRPERRLYRTIEDFSRVCESGRVTGAALLSRVAPAAIGVAGMRVLRTVLSVVGGLALALQARAADTVTFGTDWKAEAEHGGYYQAIAAGIYRQHGLDVTLRQGGPQVNHAQLLAAGRLDFNLAPNSFIPLNF